MFTNLAYESVARVAFFSGDRDVLAWAAAALSEGAKSKVDASTRDRRCGSSQRAGGCLARHGADGGRLDPS